MAADVDGIALLGNLTTTHLAMSPEEASRVGRALWPTALNGSSELNLVRLASEKDDTFSVSTNGRRYVLKVSHPDEDSSDIDRECRAMERAAEYGVPVPALLPDVHGRRAAPIRDEAGQARVARLMTFIEGVPLDSTNSSIRERERVGEVLAVLRHALADLESPAEARRCAWDVANLPELVPLLDRVDLGEHEEMLRGAINRFMTEVAPRLPTLRRQTVHNDFSKSNIIVDHDDPTFVTGIVDFGDMVRTAVVIDVSTALLNQLPRDLTRRTTEDIFADARDVLRGYLRYADLTDEELALLPHLVMGRVVVRALITLHRAALMPHNRTYILRNTEQGWGQLAWFMARSPAEVARSFS